jgi:hypothetical protein
MRVHYVRLDQGKRALPGAVGALYQRALKRAARTHGLVLGDQFQREYLGTAFIAARVVQSMCDAFQSNVAGVGQERLAAGWTDWQLRSALVADAVAVLTQEYRRCHVLQADRALQGSEEIFTQTVCENAVI